MNWLAHWSLTLPFLLATQNKNMNSEYNAQEIETQAQKYWQENKSFEVIQASQTRPNQSVVAHFCLAFFDSEQ
jgi:isoleucyl-tRNA synthetase